MPEYLYPDLCVIGAGPAGLAAASIARAHGAGVVVVERDAMGGNDHYRGSVPARALGEAARRAHAIHTAAQFGISVGAPDTRLLRVRDHIAGLSAGLSMDVSAARYEAIGARLLKAEAKFTDHRTLDAGGILVRARHFIIATGSEPISPEIPGLDGVDHFTEESILANIELPGHLVVIGGGPRGVEFVQAYRRFGAEVTLIDPAPLQDADAELAEVVLRRLRDEGISIFPGPVAAVSPGIGVALAGGETITATHLLIVRQRKPAVDRLDIDAAGLRRDRSDPDCLAVRRNLTTTNSRIYAIGDAAGGKSGQLAIHQAGLAVEGALFGARVVNEPELLPSAVFTDPEIAEVGLTEQMARTRLRARYRVLRASFGENQRARLGRRSYGLVKMIAGLDGRLLGAGVAGPEAAELISLLAFAVSRRLKVGDLAGFYAPYPTLAQIIPALVLENAPARRQNPVRAAMMAIRRVLP